MLIAQNRWQKKYLRELPTVAAVDAENVRLGRRIFYAPNTAAAVNWSRRRIFLGRLRDELRGGRGL